MKVSSILFHCAWRSRRGNPLLLSFIAESSLNLDQVEIRSLFERFRIVNLITTALSLHLIGWIPACAGMTYRAVFSVIPAKTGIQSL